MVDVATQKNAFAERLKRINSGRQFEHQDVVGYRTQKLYERKYAPKEAAKRRRTGRERLMVLVAFLSGIIAMLVGRIIFFHLSQMQGMPEAFATLGTRGVFLAALIVAGFLAAIFHLSTASRMQALALGCALMHFGEPAAASNAPVLWSELFSPAYVAEVAAGQSPFAKAEG